MRDGYSNFKFFQAVPPTLHDAADVDVDGEDVDLQGYETVTFVVNVGVIEAAVGSASGMTLLIQHANASGTGAGTYSYVESAGVLIHSALSVGALTSGIWQNSIYGSVDALMTSKVYVLGYAGSRQYVRLRLSGPVTAGQSINVGVIAILGLPANWPVNTPG